MQICQQHKQLSGSSSSKTPSSLSLATEEGRGRVKSTVRSTTTGARIIAATIGIDRQHPRQNITKHIKQKFLAGKQHYQAKVLVKAKHEKNKSKARIIHGWFASSPAAITTGSFQR